MKITKSLVREAEQAVEAYLERNLPEGLLFHDIGHARQVQQYTREITRELDIRGAKRNQLLIAALFHDTGYTVCRQNHEAESAKRAAMFLQEKGIGGDESRLIGDCILATRVPQTPKSLAEEVICDADMAHLADKQFFAWSQRLRLEWEHTENRVYTDEEWCRLNARFFEQHSYHTPAGRRLYAKGKARNYRKIQEMIAKHAGGEKGEARLAKKSAENLFRTAGTNHLRLSGMADNKAHILLSICSIIASIVLSLIAGKNLQVNYLMIPAMELLLACLGTIILAVVATQPKLADGVFAEEELQKREVNVLFFGNFHRMAFDEYAHAVGEMLQDEANTRKCLVKDLYFLGKVLAVKYKFLNWAYRVFTIGIILSILSGMAIFFIIH